MPKFYYPLIPSFFPFPEWLNAISGIAEIALGLALFSPAIRKYAAMGIVILLILFIPAHVHFIQMGSCVGKSLCVPSWVGWFRLVIIHPLLIYWAYSYRNYDSGFR